MTLDIFRKTVQKPHGQFGIGYTIWYVNIHFVLIFIYYTVLTKRFSYFSPLKSPIEKERMRVCKRDVEAVQKEDLEYFLSSLRDMLSEVKSGISSRISTSWKMLILTVKYFEDPNFVIFTLQVDWHALLLLSSFPILGILENEQV